MVHQNIVINQNLSNMFRARAQGSFYYTPLDKVLGSILVRLELRHAGHVQQGKPGGRPVKEIEKMNMKNSCKLRKIAKQRHRYTT